MLKKNIEKKISGVLNKWLESIDNGKLCDDIRSHIVVCGGCIASMLLDEEPKDYDIYFDDIELSKRVGKYYIKSMFSHDMAQHDALASSGKSITWDHEATGMPYYINDVFTKAQKDDYQPVFLSNTAITLSGGIQLVLKFFGHGKDVVGSFDFLHTKSYYRTCDGKVVIPNEVYDMVINKRLFYTGSAYPLASMIRVRKFLNRGWHISAGQIVKILLDVGELNLHDPKTLRDQLIGIDLSYFRMAIAIVEKKIASGLSFDSTWLVEALDEVFEEEFEE